MKNLPFGRELAVFLGLVLFTYASIGRDLSNPIRDCEWARIATTFAIVEKGTFAIDDYIVETADWSRFGGHYYSAKVPGPALLASPFYYLQHAIQARLQVEANHPLARNVALYIARLVTSTLPTLIALALLYTVLVRRYHTRGGLALMICGAWALGSLAMPYASLFFGHQSAAAFLAIGMCLPVLEFQRSYPRARFLLLAGLSMGLAVASDFMSVPAVALWTLWVLWRASPHPNRIPLWATWICGGAIVAAGLAWYHYVCFGSIATSPLSSKVINPRWADLNTLGFPDLGRLLQITFLPWRGLFFANPVWVLSLGGIFLLVRRGRLRENSELAISAATLVLYFGLLCMLPSAYGGWCIGPRYATCALPVMLLLLIEPARKCPKLFGTLLALSGSMMLIATLVEPLAPEDFGNPWSQFIFPRFFENTTTPQYNIFGYFLGTNLVLSYLCYAIVWGAGWFWLWRRTTAHTRSRNSHAA